MSQAEETVNEVGNDKNVNGVSQLRYDASRDQRIPFLIDTDEGQAEVVFILGPQTDEALIEYERQRNLRLVQADIEATGGVRGVEAKVKKVEASAILFDMVANGVEGFGDEGEELPDDWKKRIDKKEKAEVIDQAYLACEAVKPEVVQKAKRVSWDYRSGLKTHVVRALYEGYQLELKHILRKASTEQLDEFSSIMSQSYLVQGAMVMQGETLIPPRLKRLGKLYKKLVESFDERYVGYPPLHHQAEVVMAHLGSVLEARRKNSNGSLQESK